MREVGEAHETSIALIERLEGSGDFPIFIKNALSKLFQLLVKQVRLALVHGYCRRVAY